MTYYDLAAMLLNGFSHLYMYRQLSGYDRLSVPTMAGLSLLFTVFLGTIVSVTGYPELNGVLLLVFLLAVGLLKGGMPIIHNVLFALFSTAGMTLARLVGLETAMWLYMESPWNLYIWTPSVLHATVSVLILLAALAGRRQIALFGRYAVKGPVFIMSYVLLVPAYFALLLLTSPTSLMPASWYEQAATISYVAAFVLFFILMLVLLISWQVAKDRLADQNQQQLDEEMLAYINKLEKINDEFISFRHDYLNVLQTLDEGVRQKDLALIEDVYTKVVAPTSEQLKLREFDLLKLSNIHVPEVKSVIGVKVMSAYRQDLEVMIDIPEPVETVAMPLIDFVRVLTVLLDNAIEEAAESDGKQLQIAMFDTMEVQYVIIRNSCRDQSADVQRLFAKHVSDKAQGRGIGLFSVKRILDQTTNATLETTLADDLFNQQLLLKRKTNRS